jgi:hypothetical protein
LIVVKYLQRTSEKTRAYRANPAGNRTTSRYYPDLYLDVTDDSLLTVYPALLDLNRIESFGEELDQPVHASGDDPGVTVPYPAGSAILVSSKTLS